jgi:hypothetical protein
VIPPEQNADFVAHMEEVLDLYQQPYDPDYPVVNMDEKPIQLIEKTRTPLPASPGKPMRYDYEYERKGTASVFLFTEPLTGWRRVDAQPQRTAKQWAEQVKELLDKDYPKAKQVTLICDNPDNSMIYPSL